MKQKTSFKLIDGKIYLIYEQLVWGEWTEVHKEDITDKVMPIVDDYLDVKLGLADYKHINGRLKYTGEKKY